MNQQDNILLPHGWQLYFVKRSNIDTTDDRKFILPEGWHLYEVEFGKPQSMGQE